jgi:hypothetical protein
MNWGALDGVLCGGNVDGNTRHDCYPAPLQ